MVDFFETKTKSYMETNGNYRRFRVNKQIEEKDRTRKMSTEIIYWRLFSAFVSEYKFAAYSE